MHIGFTGTQVGMSKEQRTQLLLHLWDIIREDVLDGEVTYFHHGDCIGADAEAHDLIAQFPYIKTVIHPPEIETKRAFCKGHYQKAAKPYLKRNHDIVEECDILLVAPKSDKEELRSGTWATYRYAMKLEKAVILLER